MKRTLIITIMMWLLCFNANTSVAQPPIDSCICSDIFAPVCADTPFGVIEFVNSCFAECEGYYNYYNCDGTTPVDTLCDGTISVISVDPQGLVYQLLFSTNETVPPTNLFWDFGDGTSDFSNSSSVTHTYLQSGVYNITLNVVSADGYQCTYYATVIVGGGGDTTCICPAVYAPVCVVLNNNDTLTYSNSCFAECDGFYNYFSCNGDSTACECFSIIGPPVCVLDSSGNVVLEFANYCYAECAGYYNYTNCQSCYASFGYYPTSNNSLTIQFEDYTYSEYNILSWAWDFGDGTTSTLQNPTHTYNQEGSYLVTLTTYSELANGLDSCVGSVTYDVYVGNWGGGSPGDSTIFSGCQALFYFAQNDPSDASTIQFIDISYADGNITQWQWIFGDGTGSNEQFPIHTYNNTGVYSVTLVTTSINTTAGDSTTCLSAYTMDVYVDDSAWYPDACQAFFFPIIGGDSTGTNPLEVTFFNFSMGDNNYASFWDFGDNTTSTQTNPTHVYNTAGVYTITLAISSPNGCQSIYSMEIDLGTGLVGNGNAFRGLLSSTKDAAHNNLEQLVTFPNPVNQQVTLQFKAQKSGQAQLYLQSADGAVIRQEQLNIRNGDNQTNLNVANLPQGIYFIRIVSDGNSATTRIIKM
ncbi:MAG: PKD domain-containing protein [Saprospiraceae bacterium]|nr:PKD domain-containing protein [Saprospiraceae bacterium]MBP7680028.1 PKD domain-containing protein [Saprospiraceae bacterium]